MPGPDSMARTPDPSRGLASLARSGCWITPPHTRGSAVLSVLLAWTRHRVELSDPESDVPESEVVTDPRYQLDPDDDHPALTPAEAVDREELDYGTAWNSGPSPNTPTTAGTATATTAAASPGAGCLRT